MPMLLEISSTSLSSDVSRRTPGVAPPAVRRPMDAQVLAPARRTRRCRGAAIMWRSPSTRVTRKPRSARLWLPAAWPNRSLISLKRSRSRQHRELFVADAPANFLVEPGVELAVWLGGLPGRPWVREVTRGAARLLCARADRTKARSQHADPVTAISSIIQRSLPDDPKTCSAVQRPEQQFDLGCSTMAAGDMATMSKYDEETRWHAALS